MDEKGHDPSQSRLGWSEGEEGGGVPETRRLSRQEKEEQRKAHERDFPPTNLFISHQPDPDEDLSGWYQGEAHATGVEKSRKEPVVQLQRLPKELDKIAHQTLSRRSGPSTAATRTAAAATGSPEIEAMEVEGLY